MSERQSLSLKLIPVVSKYYGSGVLCDRGDLSSENLFSHQCDHPIQHRKTGRSHSLWRWWRSPLQMLYDWQGDRSVEKGTWDRPVQCRRKAGQLLKILLYDYLIFQDKR
jgi:hypothetical protein